MDRTKVFEVFVEFEVSIRYSKRMTKECPRCKRVLDETEYNWKIKGKRLAAYCKACSRAYIKSHYDRHISYYVEKAKKRNVVIRKELQEYVYSFLRTHPCIDCGETDVVVLEFDHKDRKIKDVEVSLIVRNMRSIRVLMQEIEKCEVRCANCHRRKTAKENKNWKLRFAPVVQRIEH